MYASPSEHSEGGKEKNYCVKPHKKDIVKDLGRTLISGRKHAILISYQLEKFWNFMARMFIAVFNLSGYRFSGVNRLTPAFFYSNQKQRYSGWRDSRDSTRLSDTFGPYLYKLQYYLS